MLELVTPKYAKQILDESNFENRHKNKNNVARLAKMMANGHFHGKLAEPIAITKDRELINGQHRLLAVIESGETVEMNVVRDADKEAFRHLDNVVKPRTNADIVAMSEFSQYAAEKAAAMRIVDMYRIRSGQIGGASSLVGYEVLNMIEDYGDTYINKFAQAASVLNSGAKLRKSTTLAGLLIGFESDKGNDTLLEEWVEGVANSKGLVDGRNDPRNRLMMYGLNAKAGRVSNQTTFIEDFNAYVAYWNKWIAKESVKRNLAISRSAILPRLSPITAFVPR